MTTIEMSPTTNSTTAIAKREEHAPAMLEPVVTVEELVKHNRAVTKIIAEGLEAGVDFGVIPGTGGKPSLLKPGAERLCKVFGCVATYEPVSTEIDHDRVVEYVDRYKKPQTSIGLYRYVVRCVIKTLSGTVVGEGIGSCSSLESKYVSRPRDVENTVLKMAEKRALVAAALGAFGLSNRFTQDVEDIERDESPQQQRRNTPAKAPDPMLVVKSAVKQELVRLHIGVGLPKTDADVAMSNAVKQRNDGKTPETIEQWNKVLDALREEPTPQTYVEREPGEDG